ncbi:MAG: ATP-binding cassette domain-containing protein [Deltaproteobacteria bacterium]
MPLEFRHAQIRNGSFTLAADLTLDAGSLTAIVGVSGSGKSTLLGGVAGFLPLREGAIFWQDARLDKAEIEDRPVSVIFQDNNLFPHLSAAQNIALARRDVAVAEITDALDQVGLSDLGPRRPSELSGGQQARVVLARTLLMRRPIVLMDEPFSALGPGQRKGMLTLVTTLARANDMTLLMVTHEPDDLALLDQVVLIDNAVAAPPIAANTFISDPPAAWRAYLGA